VTGAGGPVVQRGRVLILGLPYFGELLADELARIGWDARFQHHPGRSPRGWARVIRALIHADILYLIGSRADRYSAQDLLFRIWRRPVIIHWVGTDVLIATEELAKGPLARSVVSKPAHWCDAPWLVTELERLGVRAEYVPLPVNGLAEAAPPLPDPVRVLLYLPVDPFDRQVFDMETILRLPAALPGLEFVLIPSPPETLPGPLPPNLTARAWVDDMDALYRAVAVYVRLTSHDGMPFTVLEALSRGRHVIFPWTLPGVTVAKGFEATVAALRGFAERAGRDELELNEAGIAWVREQFAHERTLAGLDQRLLGLRAGSEAERATSRR
jgi:hypothetical protein